MHTLVNKWTKNLVQNKRALELYMRTFAVRRSLKIVARLTSVVNKKYHRCENNTVYLTFLKEVIDVEDVWESA